MLNLYSQVVSKCLDQFLWPDCLQRHLLNESCNMLTTGFSNNRENVVPFLTFIHTHAM